MTDNKKGSGSPLDKVTEIKINSWEDLELLAAQFLPQLQMIMLLGGNDLIEKGARQAHDAITKIDDSNIAMGVAMMKMSLNEHTIRENLSRVQTPSQLSTAKRIESAKEMQQFMKVMGEERYVALATTVNDLLPQRLKAFFNEASNSNPQDVEAEARADFAKKMAQTPEEIAQDRGNAQTPILPAIVSTIMAVRDNVTPEKVKTLVQTFTTSVTADDFASTAKKGATFAEELLGHIATGIAMNQTSSQSFLTEAKDRLQKVEDAVVASGLVPDMSALKTTLKQYYAEKKAQQPGTPKP